jgi:acetylornithine deacetylase/succinyl-diaminopimelate desuccinylase-like protein
MNPTLNAVLYDFERFVFPALCEFVSIPNLSPFYDPDNATVAETERVIQLVSDWAALHVPEARIECLRKPGLWPVLLIDVPGDDDTSVLCYGHLDKQPPMEGWSEGLGPRDPIVRGHKLYGRGAVDDGYAAFAYLVALRALRAQGRRRPRCLLVLETTEESQSIHLPQYFEDIFDRAGDVQLVVCLDSVCGDYERLWYTTSIRGAVMGELRVGILAVPVHSGHASPIAASPLRVARSLLSRLEDEASGEISDPALNAAIPQQVRRGLQTAASIIGRGVFDELAFCPGVSPTVEDPLKALTVNTWAPALSITGIDGLPSVNFAGNVTVPSVSLKLSTRLPPTAPAKVAAERMKQLFETDPPYGAQVSFEVTGASDGWWAGELPGWLLREVDAASNRHFGASAAPIGVGGSIPFIKPLADGFPGVPILVAGLIGPEANAHGADESLDMPACRQLTASLTDILEAICKEREK